MARNLAGFCSSPHLYPFLHRQEAWDPWSGGLHPSTPPARLFPPRPQASRTPTGSARAPGASVVTGLSTLAPCHPLVTVKLKMRPKIPPDTQFMWIMRGSLRDRPRRHSHFFFEPWLRSPSPTHPFQKFLLSCPGIVSSAPVGCPLASLVAPFFLRIRRAVNIVFLTFPPLIFSVTRT